MSCDEKPLPNIQIAGKEYDWEDETWKCVSQKKRKYDALENEQATAPTEALQVRQGDYVQHTDPTISASQLFSDEWKVALKADIKSKMRQEMNEEIQKVKKKIKNEIMQEVMEEMQSDMRLEIEKELRDTGGKR